MSFCDNRGTFVEVAPLVHRGAADLGYLRAVLDGTPQLAPKYDGDYGALTPQWRRVIASLLDELEAKLDA